MPLRNTQNTSHWNTIFGAPRLECWNVSLDIIYNDKLEIISLKTFLIEVSMIFLG